MNVRSLRPNASLENLKKQAKQLLRRAQNNEPNALARFRQYFDLKSELGLKRAQLVLAREYGFESWQKLAVAVEGQSQNNERPRSFTDEERSFLRDFLAGDLESANQFLDKNPGLLDGHGFQAHPLLRACVESNSGHCYRKVHLEIADRLTHAQVLAFRDAIVNDKLSDVRSMIRSEPALVHADFTAGRGIAQAIHHFHSAAMAEVLLDAGADIDAKTTVHHIGDTPIGLQVRASRIELVKYLLERGACPNGGLLKFMSTKAMPTIIPLLLQHEWDIDEGRGARTLLHHDSAHGHTEKVRLLLEHGADPNAEDANGQTALHIAASAHGLKIVRLLLDAGASTESSTATE